MVNPADKIKKKTKKLPADFEHFFTYDSVEDTAQCKLCKEQLSGNHKGNLLRHLSSNKSDSHESLFFAENHLYQKISNSKTRRRSSARRSDLREVITACVELVTFNARPFSLFQDSGFKKILSLVFRLLNENVTINNRTIPIHITTVAEHVRGVIRDEVRDRVISLKIDGVKRHSRSIMGVHAQYVVNGEIHLRTLGMKVLNKPSTGNISINILFTKAAH